ncbi:MAG: hypothetical protein D3923_17380, partial [Candidatus Electrothrix sp. AR3]|nr:hypothetical protein [Candidatus Electrothrix sp. AR3]
MFLTTHIREAMHNLYTAKQRTVLALVGISIGIGAVIALVSIGIIWGEEMLSQYAEFGHDILNIRQSWEEKNRNTITLEDTELLLVYTPDLIEIVPIVMNHSQYSFNGQKDSSTIIGTTSAYRQINKLRMQAGRFLSPLDRNRPHLVIGADVLQDPAFQKFNGNIVGSSIRLNNTSYTVVGVLEKALQNWWANNSMIMPISTLGRQLTGEKVSQLSARMRPG